MGESPKGQSIGRNKLGLWRDISSPDFVISAIGVGVVIIVKVVAFGHLEGLAALTVLGAIQPLIAFQQLIRIESTKSIIGGKIEATPLLAVETGEDARLKLSNFITKLLSEKASRSLVRKKAGLLRAICLDMKQMYQRY